MSVARHSYKCRLVLFSRQIVARFSQDCRATIVRHSRDIRTSVAKLLHFKIRQNFAATSSRHSQERRATVARLSRDSLAKYFGEKNSLKIFQHVEKLCDQFATQENSHDTRTNVMRKSRYKIRKTVARNSHASEILALALKH